MHITTPVLTKQIRFALLFIFSILIGNASIAQQVSGGGSHSLVMCSDGSVKAFGDNYYYQLGDTNSLHGVAKAQVGTNSLFINLSSTPLLVNGVSNVLSISAGNYHSLALENDGTVWAWGQNDFGQLGKGDTLSVATPAQVIGLSNIIAISAGSQFSLALKNDGTVWAWGDNTNGQLGDGTKQNKRKTPVQVLGLTGITAISAGDYHSMALRNDKSVWTWGANNSGQLGIGTWSDTTLPVKVHGLANAIAIDAGGSHSLALRNDGLIWAWGSNSYGELGNGTTTNDSVPGMVQLLSNVTAISAGGDHSLALKNDSTVWMWGFDMNPPQIAQGPSVNVFGSGYSLPVKINGLSSITKISCGQNHNMFYKNDGTFWGYGEDGSGQLGNGAQPFTMISPVKVICPCGSAITPTVSAGPDITICPSTNVVVHATANGISPLAYQWSPSGNFSTRTDTASPSVYFTSPGSYTCSVIVTDNNLCSSLADSMIVTVRTPSQPPYLFSNPYSTVCNGNSVTLTASGGAFPANYTWFPGGSTTTALAVAPTVNTTYTLVSTDTLGCTSQQTIIINIVDPNIDVHDVSCSQGGYALCNATGGSSPYTYLWSTSETTSAIYSLAIGNYSITVTDANGCSASKNFQIINPGPLTLAPLTKKDVTCNGQCNGKIYATVTGGTKPYNFSWNNNSYTDTIFYLCPGGYTVTVTDAGGCSATVTDSAQIVQPSVLSATISNSSNVKCYGAASGAADITVSGGMLPYTYSWLPSSATTLSVTNLTAGIYTVTVLDSNKCSASMNLNILQPPPILFSVSALNNLLCFGDTNGTAALNGSGGVTPYTYLWTPSLQTADTAKNLTANNYTATLTDNNGCLASKTVSITQPAALASNISFVNVSCNGLCDGSSVSNPTGGVAPYFYSWNTGSSTSANSHLCQGNYSLTITDNNGCAKNSTVTITQPAVLTLSMTATNLSCNGVCIGTATASPAGGTAPFTYLWSNGQVTQVASQLCAGNYSVAVEDGHNCSVADTISLHQPLPIPITATATATSCGVKNGTATSSISGAGSFPPFHILWNTGDTNLAISGLSAGIYRANVTDNHGCFSFADALVSNSNGPTVSVGSVTDVSCFGLSNGAVNINITGGVSPYKFFWSNGATTANISNVSYGPYEVAVTDAGGCAATQSIFVNQPSVLSLSSSVINSSCIVANGTASVTVSGGNSPYAYLWTLGGTASSKSSLGAGAYGVTVTDSKGCKDSMLIAVQDSGGPVAFIDSIAAANCGGNGFVLISPLDSSSIASYKWTTGASTQNLLNASPGKYGVVITDTSGCKSVLVVPVNPVLPPVKPICLVTVDTLSSMNIVVWDKPISTFISGFNIYRESSQNGIYQLVGFVPYSSPSIFYDTISDPDSRWAKYRISMKDICGKEGPLSPEHKTIHLSIPNYAPKNVDLIWDDYVGYIFSYYHIFRKLNSTGNWVLIDSVPAGVHLYKDTTLLPFGDTANYHVEISNAGGCNVTIMNPSSGGRQNPHLMATNLNTSRSNVYKISDTTATEVHSMEQFKSVSIFPNPNNGVFTVAASGKNIDQIKILNMLGEEVKAVQFKNRNAQMINVDMHSHAKGLYNVQLIIQGQVINKKIIIE